MLLDFFVSFTSIKSTLSDICKILTNTIIDVFWNQTIWQNFRCIVTNTVNAKLFWWNSVAIRIFQTTVSTIKVAIHSVVFVITKPVTNQGFVTLWNKKTKDMFVLVALKLVKSFAEFYRLVNSKTESRCLHCLITRFSWLHAQKYITFPEIWKEKNLKYVYLFGNIYSFAKELPCGINFLKT